MAGIALFASVIGSASPKAFVWRVLARELSSSQPLDGVGKSAAPPRERFSANNKVKFEAQPFEPKAPGGNAGTRRFIRIAESNLVIMAATPGAAYPRLPLTPATFTPLDKALHPKENSSRA
jgi:hypothetical protein